MDRYEVVPVVWSKLRNDEWQRKAANTINLLLNGKRNAVGVLMLDPGSETTELRDPRITEASVIALAPRTAAAAAAQATTYVISTLGVATVHHANEANSDRVFGYTITG